MREGSEWALSVGEGGDGGSVTGWRETKHSLRLIAAPGFAFQF